MNRYVVSGAISDAQAGKSVIVVAKRDRLAVYDFEAAPSVESVDRTNGIERVTFHGGGYVRLVRTGRGGLRGASVDVVVLDRGTPLSIAVDARIAVASRGGEVIEA